MNDENFFNQYPHNPYQSPFPQQPLKKGERYVMRKRKNFWGEEIVEFYVASQVDDAPAYRIVMMVFFLSIALFLFKKCDHDKPSDSQNSMDKTEQVKEPD
jgi:hypothetical protein